MKLSLYGRFSMALFASLVLGLGMTACGGGTIAYLWVLGQQYNNVAGFKVDDYTGNLTQIINSPFASNGSKPVSIQVSNTGRFVFVLNQGTGGGASGRGTSSGVSVFTVGGDGVLVYQASYSSQGYVPQWMQLDSTGNYLYVLDKYSPGCDPDPVTLVCKYDTANTDGFGAITAFAIDSTTGRLSLVTNSQILNHGVNTPFFEVGGSPFQMKTLGNCLLTVNSADNSISPYQFAGGGQLSFAGGTGRYLITGANHISSINGSGSYVFLTDSGANTIDPFSLAGSCVLTPVTGGNTPNLATAYNPTYTLLDSTNKYLYVLNQSAPPGTSQPASSISAFTVNLTNGQLQGITGAPYTVGSGPVCMVEDPTHQYIYVSNYNDGTVTGKLLDPTTGILSSLTRGSTFPAVGQASCLTLSGQVD
ncbi:MAG: beta-propeller fold lactonase family protein [Acidobacteriota bacterium]